MPPGDPTRMQASRQLFQSLIDSEPELPNGYAGKSLSHSINVFVS